MSNGPWNSLEIAKLVISILTPLSVVALGWLINRRLKKLDHIQWSNQKVIEKRLSLYDEIAPLINKLFCFYMWVGDWKDISPADIIEAKRTLDKTINIYRDILGEDFYIHYKSFVGLLFETFAGPGQDAKIRSHIISQNGDRSKNSKYEWNKTWDNIFSDDSQVSTKQIIYDQYHDLMSAFKNSIGIM